MSILCASVLDGASDLNRGFRQSLARSVRSCPARHLSRRPLRRRSARWLTLAPSAGPVTRERLRARRKAVRDGTYERRESCAIEVAPAVKPVDVRKPRVTPFLRVHSPLIP